MNAEFDPYYKWLGIPPQDQPADHYRLLGLTHFESDLQVIESAADRQMVHLRTFATGPHGAQSQKLLNEVAAARVCLLNSSKKQAYDEQLHAKLAPVQRPPLPAMVLAPSGMSAVPQGQVAEIPVIEVPIVKVQRRSVAHPRQAKRPAWQHPAALSAAATLMILVLAVAFAMSGGDEVATNRVASQSQAPNLPTLKPTPPKPIQPVNGSLPNAGQHPQPNQSTVGTTAANSGEQDFDGSSSGSTSANQSNPTLLAASANNNSSTSEPPQPSAVGSTQPPRRVALLKSIDLLRHRIDGDWKQSGNQLSVSPGKARLRLPFRPGDQSYDLHIGARRDYGADALIVGLVFQGREFLALIDRDEATLLSQVDGQRQSSEAQWRHRVFKQGQFADIVISVREDRLSIVVNNATVATWTDYGRLSANPDWNEGVGLLLLASNDSAFTFSKIIATQPSVSSINAVAASANLPASTSAASLAVASNAANAATSGSFAGVGKPSTGQKPAPAEAARSKAQASFQQVYESKLKQATRPADKAALARELANQARSATGDPADHYVLLAEARRLAAEAGDTTLAIELITELERYFQNDYWPSRVAALTSAADHSSTPEARHAVLTTSLELAEQAAKQDDYQSAVALSGLAVGAANSLKDAAYIKAAKERQAEYKSREKLWEQASQARDKLKDAPDDPSANLIWGKYLCLMRNDWESGVKLLAKGSDTRIREAAELELAQSNTPETRAQAGDSWFAAAEANKSDKQAWLSRSKQWYEQAAVQLATAERARVEKRIGEINEQLDRLTGGKARAAFPLTGLVGKVFVDNKDVNLVIHYQPGKTFSSQVVKDLLARYNIKGKAIQIRLSGALRLLSDTDTNIYVGNNGVPIGNVLDITGTERHRIDGSGQNGRYSKFEILRKGDYLISWTIGGTTIEDCSMSLEATQQNWQPLPIVHTQGMLDSMRARRARAEVDVSIN